MMRRGLAGPSAGSHPERNAVESKHAPRALAVIVVLYLLLGTVYSIVTPVFEAPDESFHFFFVQYVREKHELPVQGQRGENLYGQEGSQPPLYYVAGALLTSWIDVSDARTLLRQNPQANIGVPGDPGNKNRFIHTAQESFPYRGTVLAVHVLRWGSVVLGLVVVVCTYAAAHLLWPTRPAIATLAAALVAFTPQFIFISSSVNNDNLINALAAVSLYLLLRLWRGDRSRRTVGLLAIVLGLALLSKLGGLITLGFAVFSIGYLGLTRRAQAWRWALRSIVIVLAGAVLIGGWWYLRNWQLYGDVTGLAAMYDVVGARALSLSELIAELPGLWYSLWGIFGWFNLALPEWLYLLYTSLVLLAIVGAIVAGVKWLKQRRAAERHWPIEIEALSGLAIYALLILIGVLRWTSTTHGSQGRLLFPAALALAILWAAGLTVMLRSRHVLLGAGVLLCLIAAMTPLAVLAPAYATPQHITLHDIPAGVERLNLDFNGTLRLIGGRVETPAAQPGDLISVVLYWQALRPPDREYMVFVHLLGRDLELVGNEDAYHGQGTFPTDLWRGDEIIADRFTLRLHDNVRAPTLVRVEVGVRDRSTKQPVAVTQADGATHVGLTLVGDFVLRAAAKPAPSAALHYRFNDQIELVGYDAPRADASGEIVYRLYWRAATNPSGPVSDYTVFAHALDAAGQMIGQGDGQPFGGDYPTSRWLPNETIVEDRVVKPDNPTPAVALALGLYRLADGTRLPIVDSAGQRVPNDEIVLPVKP